MVRGKALAVLLLVSIFLIFGCNGNRNESVTPTPAITPTPTPAPTAPPITPAPTATPTPAPQPTGPECSSDADCVPAQCCHPTYCVSRNRAPDCNGTYCTLECSGGTLDCGQGSCACIGSVCGVSWLSVTPTPFERPTPAPTPFRLCRSTTNAGELGKRGTTLGEYNGRLGLYEDSCFWNGTDNVIGKYYCNLINGSNEVVHEFHSCPTRCVNEECDECVCGAEDITVCGADGRTYGSECYARCHNTTMVKYGQCDQTCFALNATCRTSSDCCSGKCDPWTKSCVECVFDSECVAGTFCGDGRCKTECVRDSDCPAGKFCYSGRCG